MKLSQEQIDTINTNLITLMADVEHQLICIEGELDYEKEDTNRLSDMWDCNDSGNWEAMLNSLQRIKELFNKPTGGSMAKKATVKKKVASKKTTKKAAPKKATKKASSKKVAKRKPVRVKNNNNS